MPIRSCGKHCARHWKQSYGKEGGKKGKKGGSKGRRKMAEGEWGGERASEWKGKERGRSRLCLHRRLSLILMGEVVVNCTLIYLNTWVAQLWEVRGTGLSLAMEPGKTTTRISQDDTGVKGNEACKVLSRVAGSAGGGTCSLRKVDNAYSSPMNASVLETHTPIMLVHA